MNRGVRSGRLGETTKNNWEQAAPRPNRGVRSGRLGETTKNNWRGHE